MLPCAPLPRKMLSPDARAQQLATIDSSIAHVRSSQQAASRDHQVAAASLASVQAHLEALMQEQERLGTEASRFKGFLLEKEATISQYQKEMSLLEQEKDTGYGVAYLVSCRCGDIENSRKPALRIVVVVLGT